VEFWYFAFVQGFSKTKKNWKRTQPGGEDRGCNCLELLRKAPFA
jgi:hypothetical protein